MAQNEHYQGWNGSRMTGILEMVMNLLFIQRYKDQGVFLWGRIPEIPCYNSENVRFHHSELNDLIQHVL
jgi:hypothetical protein